MNILLIIFGKITLWISKTFKLGSGSTWPGHIAMETNNNFVRDILKKNPKLQIILVAGTNGKTTTSLMLQKMLEQAKLKAFRNEAGANLLNGVASTLISNCSIFGKINFDAAIFEVDENNVGEAVKQMENSKLSIVLLNLFRDQLDRYGEVNTVAKKWDKALASLPTNTTIFTNGDDPKLADIANDSTLVRYYFGLDEKLMKKKEVGYDVDFTYCPNCGEKLKYSKVAYSHLGKFACPNCQYTNHETETFPDLPQPLMGLYNVYNQNAAAIVAHMVFGISIKDIILALVDFKPAFGRQEVIRYKNREVIILLSKNPAGANQSIDAIASANKKGNVLLVLNDRIPDGTDVSWIWDVDFENIPKDLEVFVSGDRTYDMGLRIKYLGNRKLDTNIIPDLQTAIDQSIAATKPDETLFIMPTYSAMLETRKILTGKAIL